jgi:hypothetical protein
MRSNRASPQSWQQRPPSPVGLDAFLFERRESFCGRYSSALTANCNLPQSLPTNIAGLKLGGTNGARI